MSIQHLAQLKIERAIFHDVPSKNKFEAAQQLVLCDVETVLDPKHHQLLKNRLVQVVDSTRAYPIQFEPVTSSPIPGQVRSFTAKPEPDAFVPMSKAIATFLHSVQHGAVSGGLLCVLDVSLLTRRGIVLMKLEREQGAQLKLIGEPGKKTYDMSVLDNLVLTDGTRLFKTAMFVRHGAEDDDFQSRVCDVQGKPTAGADLARFWMRFLGGQVLVQPRVATQQFYDAALDFINEVIESPVTKQDVYEHLHSQMKSAAPQFAPKLFMEDFIPSNLHATFRQHMKDRQVSMSVFKKDLSDIEARLKRAHYRTKLGAVVTVPVEKINIIDVKANQIVISDQLKSVDRS